MEENTAVQNIDLKLISDHTDERGKPLEELLGRDDMVQAIMTAIMEVEPPFTFGIYGSWGSGKTHFMKSVKAELDKIGHNKESPKIPITVEFEAWKHQRDKHPEISMLNCLRKALQDYDIAEDEDAENCMIGLNTFVSSLDEISVKIPFLSVKASPAQARKEYDKWVEAEEEKHFKKTERQVGLQDEFNREFERVVTGAKNARTACNDCRIVFFIDDLDRCLDDTIIKMLEQIKLFLWNEQCVFVLGADHKVIEGVVDKGKYAQGRKYLEKIVNFPFYLPPLSDDAPSDFFKDKITGVSSNRIIEEFKNASIASKANLRQMIRLANTYKLNSYLTARTTEKRGAQYYEEITAIFTALQTLHEEFFNKICENRRGDERENNLKAFFREPSEEESDPIVQLFDRKNSEPKTHEPIDLAVIDPIRSWARKFRSETVNFENILLSVYVEFLASQSAAKKASDDDSKDPSMWYEEDSWGWYKKKGSAGRVESTSDVKAKTAALEELQLIELDGYPWRVIEVKKDNAGKAQEALLLSEHIIGYGRMDNKPEDWGAYTYSWPASALCEKLNSTDWLNKHLPVLNASGMIQENHALKKGDDSGPLGKVFLLSTDEVEALLKESSKATTPQGEADWWWLRSRDVGNPRSAARVDRGGDVRPVGWFGVYNTGGVRPALWLNLKS